MQKRGLLVSLVLATLGSAAAAPAQVGPTVIKPVFAGTSPALTQLLASPKAMAAARAGKIENVEIPNPEFLFPAARSPKVSGPDPVLQSAFPQQKVAGSLLPAWLSFEGATAKDNRALLRKRPVPPDSNGDVGLNYYAQMTNNISEIFDKSTGASVAGPFPSNLFFAGSGSFCEERNSGDPIVLYDHQAKRWIFSQFALNDPDGNGHQCFAISKSRDPLGAYHLYDFVAAVAQAGGNALNDYEKIGVWPDGLYYSHNEFVGRDDRIVRFASAVIAFDKEAMYDGDPDAIGIKFLDDSQTGPFNIYLLPTHWEGKKKPKAGTPNIFWQALDEEILGDGNGIDGYRRWAFRANFKRPERSTFTELPRISVPAFSHAMSCARNCFDQPPPGTVAKGHGLDDVGGRLMYRVQWRSFPGYDSVVLNHTVNADGQGRGGIRWAELRDDGSGFQLFQTGTFAPADGDHRFMASIAQDRQGNIALGYTVTGLSTFPSVRYTGRAGDDPLGQMQAEQECHAGTGVQARSKNRWGDYSTMSVDPQDECTFWYTQEYYDTKKKRDTRTRICSFRFDTCG